MSRRGNCWDNAVAESFFATLKVELAHEAAWATRGQARGEVFEYIEQFYNGQRRHSALGYLTSTFERRWATEGNTGAAAASPTIAEAAAGKARAVEAPGSTRRRGAISISPGVLRDPHQQHPWCPRGGSADTGPPSSRVSHPLTAVSTEPGQVTVRAGVVCGSGGGQKRKARPPMTVRGLPGVKLTSLTP